MGLLDNLLNEGKKYIRDAMPGGLLNPEITKQSMLDGAAIASTPVPVAGDLLGLLADVNRYKENPEERTAGNFALTGLGLLPFVPSFAGVVSGGKIADALNQVHGDKVDAFLGEGKNINLSKIVAKDKNAGAGTAFMSDLIAAADKEGKTVTLSPSSDFGGNKARLEDFYSRFGFVKNKGKNKDYEISESMYRVPAELSPVKPYDINNSQRAVTENLSLLGISPEQYAPFTYLMPQRQVERTAQVQLGKNGPLPDNYGIEVSQSNNAFHPFDSRKTKDDMERQQVAEMLGSIYHHQSQVGSPIGQKNTFALVNTKQPMDGKAPVGLFSIIGGKIVPETAYTASETKAKDLLKKK